MKEDLLHFLWRTRRFDPAQLLTTEGEKLEIIHPGDYNPNAGADFSHARLRIGETLWAGNVEMHLLSSDWYRHQHQYDDAYRNVILHVVLEEDLPVCRSDGSRVPCLEMKQLIPRSIAANYRKLQQEEHWIPCQPFFQEVPEVTVKLWLERLTVERLEQKTGRIRQSLEQNNNDWEETFYQAIARSFGLKVNADPFETLARSLPLSLLSRYLDDLDHAEALLFGQAGMLSAQFEEEYPRQLQREYLHLQRKHQLEPLDPVVWKLLRLHPGNFPAVRLAQLARLLCSRKRLLPAVIEATSPQQIARLFQVEAGGYWLTHLALGQAAAPQKKSLGKAAVELLLINTVAPFLFLFGETNGDERIKQQALDLLEKLPAENNALIKGWQQLGIKARTAAESQALLQLKNNYCDRRRCLECAIGGTILR